LWRRAVLYQDEKEGCHQKDEWVASKLALAGRRGKDGRREEDIYFCFIILVFEERGG